MNIFVYFNLLYYFCVIAGFQVDFCLQMVSTDAHALSEVSRLCLF